MNPNDKPYPVRLGDIKPILQQEAFEKDWSMAHLIKKVLKEYLISSGKIQPCPKK